MWVANKTEEKNNCELQKGKKGSVFLEFSAIVLPKRDSGASFVGVAPSLSQIITRDKSCRRGFEAFAQTRIKEKRDAQKKRKTPVSCLRIDS